MKNGYLQAISGHLYTLQPDECASATHASPAMASRVMMGAHLFQRFEDVSARALLPHAVHGCVSLGIHRPVPCSHPDGRTISDALSNVGLRQ